MLKKILTIAIVVLMLQGACVFANDEITISINGKEIKTDTPVVLKDDRTFIPVRFVAEGLGAKVQWKSDEKSVYIYSGAEETIPLSEWYGDDFKKMMEEALLDLGLSLENVRETGPISYRYSDEEVGMLSHTCGPNRNKLIIEFYGEGSRNSKFVVLEAIWIFDIDTHEYQKVCNGSFVTDCYIREKYTDILPCWDTDGNIIFFDTQTYEQWIMSEVSLLGLLKHTVFYTKKDGNFYVKNLDDGTEKVYKMPEELLKYHYRYNNSEYVYIQKEYLSEEVYRFDIENGVWDKMSIYDTLFPILRKPNPDGTVGRESRFYYDDREITNIYVNNELVENIPEAFVLNDRTYVPVRFVAEALGAEVTWIDGENRVEIKKQKTGRAYYQFAKESNDIEKYYI